MISIWKVFLRNPDGETTTILIENATSQINAKIMAVDVYDRKGWYATDAALTQTKRKNHE